ncbi:HTH-type transcriptional activator AmpR [Dickeya solani]|nr:HTH-type transcriptional activator AmpR [Dickeya solani]
MITFKQMDALIWIVNMGSFEAAASKLNMSQSAISKRIHEIEEAFDIEIFDRKSRNARLTHKGRELLDYCQDIVTRRDAMLERISNKKILFSNLRLGVTELTAMTWLPGLIENIRADYPRYRFTRRSMSALTCLTSSIMTCWILLSFLISITIPGLSIRH